MQDCKKYRYYSRRDAKRNIPILGAKLKCELYVQVCRFHSVTVWHLTRNSKPDSKKYKEKVRENRRRVVRKARYRKFVLPIERWENEGGSFTPEE